jgi:hypothetical protein
LAVGTVRWSFVEGAIDIEVVIFKAPFVDNDIRSQYGSFNVFRVPVNEISGLIYNEN